MGGQRSRAGRVPGHTTPALEQAICFPHTEKEGRLAFKSFSALIFYNSKSETVSNSTEQVKTFEVY